MLQNMHNNVHMYVRINVILLELSPLIVQLIVIPLMASHGVIGKLIVLLVKLLSPMQYSSKSEFLGKKDSLLPLGSRMSILASMPPESTVQEHSADISLSTLGQ